MTIRTATGLIAAYMRLFGFCGWTGFWRTIKSDGRLLFYIKYSWWTLLHGYWNKPYEVEARAVESKSP